MYVICPHVYYACWQIRGQGISSAVLKDLARSASEDQRSACLSEHWTVTDPAYSVDAGDRTQALTSLTPPIFHAIFSKQSRIQEGRMNLLGTVQKLEGQHPKVTHTQSMHLRVGLRVRIYD